MKLLGLKSVSIIVISGFLAVSFRPQSLPGQECYACADADGNKQVNITDAIHILQYLFMSGPTPACPLTNCGGQVCSGGNVYGTVTGATGAAFVWALKNDDGLPGDAEGPFETDPEGKYCIAVGNGAGELPPGSYLLTATSTDARSPELVQASDAVGVFDADKDRSSACPRLLDDPEDFVNLTEDTRLEADIELCELCVTVTGTVPAASQILLGLASAKLAEAGKLYSTWSFLWRSFSNAGVDANKFTIFLPEGPQYLILAAGVTAIGDMVLGFHDKDNDGSNNCSTFQPMTGDLIAPKCGDSVKADIDNVCKVQ